MFPYDIRCHILVRHRLSNNGLHLPNVVTADEFSFSSSLAYPQIMRELCSTTARAISATDSEVYRVLARSIAR